MSKFNYHKLYLFIPALGILGFFLLYYIATLYYPGGSYADLNADKFSWMHNYWCHLLDTETVSGKLNPAKPVAIGATISLCVGIGYFFFEFPKYFAMRTLWKYVVRVFGMASMFFAVFLFTNYHDMVLNIAGGLGLFAILGTLLALKRNNSYTYWWVGWLCVLLIGLNNYIYYSHVYVEYLPLIQKITLMVVLLWLIHINVAFYKVVKDRN